MVVAIDTSGFAQTIAPPPPFVRAPQPDAAARQRPRREGREADVGGERTAQSFKSILNAQTGSDTGVARATSGMDSAAKAAAMARPEKVPQRRPAEFNADDGSTIYQETQLRQARTDIGRPPTALLAAVASYAERVLAASGAFAARGDNLELTA
jgi:hypothetical protein